MSNDTVRPFSAPAPDPALSTSITNRLERYAAVSQLNTQRVTNNKIYAFAEVGSKVDDQVPAAIPGYPSGKHTFPTLPPKAMVST